MRILIILAVTFLLGGCLTEKKVSAWNDKHQKEAAQYCADNYPCIIKKGDTTYVLGDSTKWIEMIEDYEGTIRFINEVNDSLIIALQHDKDCAQYEQVIQRQKKEIASLRNKIKPVNCPEDTVLIKGDTIIDSAATHAMRLKWNHEVIAHSETKQQVNKLKDKLNWWKIACLITWGILGIGIALKVGMSIKKPI